MAEDQARVETLKQLYSEVIRESDRLRDARGAFSRQLGPLPVAGGLVLGLFSAFKHPPHNALAWVAVGLFGASVCVSMLASGLAPYRRLRARIPRTKAGGLSETATPGSLGDDFDGNNVLDQDEWLLRRIKLELELYGQLSRKLHRWALLGRLLRRRIRTLQDAFEIERYAVLLVQLLFLAEIALLFVSV